MSDRQLTVSRWDCPTSSKERVVAASKQVMDSVYLKVVRSYPVSLRRIGNVKSANPEHWDFYMKLRRRMVAFASSPSGQKHRFREVLLLGPDLLHLCIHLLKDPDVPGRHKAKLAAAVVYFISPLDLLPEALFGPIGYLDDIALTAYVLNAMLNEVPEHVVNRYWAGDRDLFPIIRGIVMGVDRMLGKGLWSRVLHYFNRGQIPPDMTHPG
jgi:uncharacterized membrane protein YkvA (DUF1232 family)